jgi:tRNA-modifying protein YgfZ
MPIAHLSDRAMMRISGPEAEAFLQNLITTDLGALKEAEARPSALLSPQGKVMFDFLISRSGPEAFTIDIAAPLAGDFARRLTMYRLRAKIEIGQPIQAPVAVSWGSDSAGFEFDPAWLADRRFPVTAGVLRRHSDLPEANTGEDDWHRLRIEQGVAESGQDFAAGDAFPHDLLYDFNGGVGLKKGCFVGQEVVSRMQHRGTARRRVLTVSSGTALPAPGTTIEADGRAIGTLGSVSGTDGLAILRIDRAKAAMDKGSAIRAGEAVLSLSIPSWAGYTFPQDAAEADDA